MRRHTSVLKSLLVAATVAVAGLTGVVQSTAIAAAPAAISIRGTVTQFGPPPAFQGVWQSSGGITDAGTFVETELHPTGSLAHSPVVGAFQAVIVFSGSQGTFAVNQQAIFTADARRGRWEVGSGTGAYEGLRGHGTFEFVFPNSLTFTGVISMAA